LRQQFLKASAGAARAWVVIAEAFEQFDLVALDAAWSALDVGL
jgi:hypothetical protein